MERILKFPLASIDGVPLEVPFELPRGSTPLAVAEQHGQLVLWARCPIDQPFIDYPVHLLWTGDHLDPAVNYRHVGTVLASNALVWHVFVEPSEPVPSAR